MAIPHSLANFPKVTLPFTLQALLASYSGFGVAKALEITLCPPAHLEKGAEVVGCNKLLQSHREREWRKCQEISSCCLYLVTDKAAATQSMLCPLLCLSCPLRSQEMLVQRFH